jgi:hypothetical protein
MDRRGGLAVLALVAGTIAGCSVLTSGRDGVVRPPEVMNWVSPPDQAVSVLTRMPVSCRLPPATPDQQARQLRGRLVFESTALLGGQAARSGMSCATCHRNGRGNPHFRFPGVSDAPGTADVTTGFFSKERGDDRFNPVPIPDLAVRAGAKFPDRGSEPFRDFVRGLVVEEFQGVPPTPGLFEDLLIYLDGLDIRACADPGASLPVTWRQDWQDARAAVAAAGRALTENDSGAARFMLRAARYRLGTLHERYAVPGGNVQRKLVKASRRLERALKALPGDPETAGRILGDWNASARSVERALDRHAESSLFNPEVLARAVAASQAP